MIIAENISKYFNGTVAVKEVSFEVRGGETLVLLGTSGCGKTTTLRMLNRLIEPTTGRILINGEDILSLQPESLRKGIGYVLQNNGLFPHYTVAENIALVPGLLKWPRPKIRNRISTLLNKLQLPAGKYANAYPSELSGGQQQRVGLARALAADPPILLMDEPFGALDPITRADIRKEFRELDELKTKTIVLVTHDVQEAFELGNRICLMDKGAVMQIAAPPDLLFQPANQFVKDFFSHQRLQLELKSISLHSIWNLLPDITPGHHSPSGLPLSVLPVSDHLRNIPVTPSFNSSQSLWEAIEILSKAAGTEPLLVYDQSTRLQKEINFLAILKAYQQIKRA